MKIKLLALVLLALIINYASAKRSLKEINTIEELNVKLQKAFDGSKLPGFSVVAANGKQVIFQKCSMGLMDRGNCYQLNPITKFLPVKKMME